MGRIRTSPRYVVNTTGLNQLSLGELGRSSALASLVLLDVVGRWKLVGLSGTGSN